MLSSKNSVVVTHLKQWGGTLTVWRPLWIPSLTRRGMFVLMLVWLLAFTPVSFPVIVLSATYPPKTKETNSTNTDFSSPWCANMTSVGTWNFSLKWFSFVSHRSSVNSFMLYLFYYVCSIIKFSIPLFHLHIENFHILAKKHYFPK